MLQMTAAFSGFSVSEIKAAKTFYGDVLGIPLEDEPGMGFRMKFQNGHTVFIYPKVDHVPAEFTVLNFPVSNIDQIVDSLVAQGIVMEHYESLPAPQDEKGILRGLAAGYGPDIAWFKDPAGNILSVLQEN